METQQRIALVTGANRGLGLETARQLVRDHGYVVWIGSRDLRKGEAAAKAIGQGARAVELDVANTNSVTRAIAQIKAECGQLDALINNAGMDYDMDQRASHANMDRVRTAFDTNFFGPWDLVVQALPLLRGSEAGRIVNVSSGAGSLSDMGGGTAGYGTSKAALNALTLKLAAELQADGIKVNSVCPGWVATDMGGGGRPIPEGARGIVWAATLDHDGPTGCFSRDGRPISF